MPLIAIYLIPIGEIEPDIMEYLSSALEEKFKVECSLGKPLEEPDYAYNRRRKQYLSSPILDELRKKKPPKASYVLGVIDKDLFVPPLNFIFGEADMIDKVAIISLTRLRQEFYGNPEDEALFKLRALKEAVHELGHTFGLRHCPNPTCVMHFSNSLADTDIKADDFCPDCRSKVEFLFGEER